MADALDREQAHGGSVGVDDHQRVCPLGHHQREGVAERGRAGRLRLTGGRLAVQLFELDLVQPAQRKALQPAVGADEALDELVGRVGEDVVGVSYWAR